MFNNVTSRYDLTDATWEIIIMLLVAFLLGFLLRHIFCCNTESEENIGSADGTIPQMTAFSEPDEIEDLKIVEGIGPKIESLLHLAGIRSMRNLSSADASAIKKILNDAGPSFTMHDPKTWSTQAKLIVDEDWNKLKEYQDFLNGGRDA